MTKQAKKAVDFILTEILEPFPESSLYDDYREDWEVNHVGEAGEIFDNLYEKAVCLIAAAPELLEALEDLISIAEATHGAQDRIIRARLAIAKAMDRVVT